MGNTVIQSRNDTAADWTSDNPTLAQGEMGLETDTNRIKFGDGTTAWNSLPYVSGTAFKYGLYTLSANQTSNFATNNHVEFNTVQGSLGGLSTGSGQANGIISLPAGKTYKITGSLGFQTSAAGYSFVQAYDRTNSNFLGLRSDKYSMNYTGSVTGQSNIMAIITPVSNIDIDIRYVSTSNVINTYASLSWVLIEEYAGY